MSMMASQITSLTVVYSIGTGEFPAQRASNADNVSIWWRHHDLVASIRITAIQISIKFALSAKASIIISEINSPGAVSIRKTVLPGVAIPMLKIRRPNGRLIFNMEIAIRRSDGLYIETGPWSLWIITIAFKDLYFHVHFYCFIWIIAVGNH